MSRFFSLRVRSHLWVFLICVVAALGMTWPTVLHLAENTVPTKYMDVSLYYWNLWWFKMALLDLGTNPVYTSYLFAPIGTTLASHTLTPYYGLIGIPLQLLFGLSATFGLIYLSTFILSVLGMYLLIYHLTEDRQSSLVGAIIFTFAPWHMLHAKFHLNLLSIQFIPLFILYLLKLLERPGAKYAILAGVYMALTALSDWNYLLFILLFVLVFLIWAYLNEKGAMTQPKFLYALCGMMGVCLFLVSPFLIPLLRVILSGEINIAGEGGAREYSADLAAFFVPSNLHPLWGDSVFIRGLYSKLSGGVSEGTVFLGYTALFLGVVGVLRVEQRLTRLWVAVFALFLVLSLGPDLQVFGKEYLGFTRLPYNWLIQHTPILKGARVPARFTVMTVLALSVLAGLGLKKILLGFAPRQRALFSTMVAGLILFEFMAKPVFTEMKVPEPYKKFAQDKGAYSILDVPVAMPQNVNLYMAYQTVHQKPIISGYISRVIPKNWKFINEDPFVRLLHYPELITPATLDTMPVGLIRNKIKYVLVHRNNKFYNVVDAPYFDHTKVRIVRGEKKEAFLANIHKLLSRHLKRSPLSGENITVYKVY
ncbi:MAG: hypothetical protein HOC91_10460 [Nitrospinaceae bacterium]|nr:hypothetical protein [Nitrospinaceae bacterium]MBT3435389.1 hypothetical protein [Nitrospinaceae bacterium]MBT4093229.1 hypothetical protein [Nitrospinaceae bacterium]MBT4430926.1 hypothetical protein [Nitrospinaceae bacterium]MBT5367522.1 hypothetical protein [Nitrospinaceae bacterium]